MSGSLFDFGLYFFHNAKALLSRGTAPYFYLPKMESHLEARLWNDVFIHAQQRLGIPRGTIKATVLIETILAAFEMDEFLYELREHSAGLNCGRWDYIFSCLKKFGRNPDFILADRGLVSMTSPFMRAYSLLLIKTCHRRNAHAIGGMAAQIPIKTDPAANEAALAKVRADKEREASDGHDGTWVAHPGLVPLAMEVFDRLMPAPNQLNKKREDVQTTAADLLRFEPQGPITEAGLHFNIEVGDRLPRRLAGRHRLRADQPSDGRRGDRRDLPLPGVAVDTQPARRAGRRAQGDAGDGARDDPGAAPAHSDFAWGKNIRRRQIRTRREAVRQVHQH